MKFTKHKMFLAGRTEQETSVWGSLYTESDGHHGSEGEESDLHGLKDGKAVEN